MEELIPSSGIRSPLPLWTQVKRFIPCLFCSLFFLAGALVITNGRMPDPQVVRPLPDVLFELFPKVAEVELVTDVIIFLLNLSAVLVMIKVYVLELVELELPLPRIPLYFESVTNVVNKTLFTPIDSGKRPYKLQNCCAIGLIRFLVTYILTTFFRAFVIVMTSYPATDNHCQHPQHIDHPFINMILTIVTMGSGAIHCGDLMYSGHTIILCLSCSMLWEYGTYVHRYAFRVVAPSFVLFSFYCIVASRSHYTDDILVSAYVTVATFLVVRHVDSGAPWQMQLLIRYWPCLGSNVDDSPHAAPTAVSATNIVVVTTEELTTTTSNREESGKSPNELV